MTKSEIIMTKKPVNNKQQENDLVEWMGTMIESLSVIICEISGKDNLVVRMGNYDKVCISDYLCNLCRKKALVVGLGLPIICFSAVKKIWWGIMIKSLSVVICEISV